MGTLEEELRALEPALVGMQAYGFEPRSTLDGEHLGLWYYHVQTDCFSWNARASVVFGVDPCRTARDAAHVSPGSETLQPITSSSKPTPLSMPFQGVVHPDDRRVTANALASAVRSGKFGPLQHRVVLPNGNVRWVNNVGLGRRAPNGVLTHIVGSLMDITPQKTLETRWLEAQRLAAAGRLAGGLVHDFNNMLTAILGHVELARETCEGRERDELIDAIYIAAQRSSALAKQLLSFSHLGAENPQLIEPNTIVRRMESLFRRTLGPSIRTTLELESRGLVLVDESRLEQVVVNLITNARDAMPHGGTMTIETRDVHMGDGMDSRAEDGTSSHVLIAVTDTGIGMAPDVLHHVFEPFFTTRAGGTGLGLATSHGTVLASGGTMTVQSELGRGSTFRVFLPRAAV